MAEPRSLVDLLSATSRQKLAAARARQRPDATAEKPRDAILEALHLVHEAIAADGFSFVPSGPKFSRKRGDFTFEISVQSDRNNVSGQRAAIWVHVGVYSKILTAWRKTHHSDWIRPKAPFPMPLYVNQIGYLCEPPGWVEFDFADKATRRVVADDLMNSIRTGAFRCFAIFESSIEDIAAVSDQDWPPPEGILSYLLAMGRVNLASETLRTYLHRRPEFRRDFDQFFQQFSEHGLPAYRAALPHDLAAFAVATGLMSNGNEPAVSAIDRQGSAA